jgi:hypothetical protein
MILYLRYSIFLCGGRYDFEVAAPDIKKFMNIQDNKTLKASFNNLYDNGYLLMRVGQLKPNKPIYIKLHQEKFDISKRTKGESFTQLPTNVLFAIKDGKITAKEARILYYIKSYIIDKEYCFTSQLTMGHDLDMTEKTVAKHIKLLKQKKLLNVEKHKLGTEYKYDDNDKIVFTKYNNHYTLRMENVYNL